MDFSRKEEILSEPQEVLVGRLVMRSITDLGEMRYLSDLVGSGIFWEEHVSGGSLLKNVEKVWLRKFALSKSEKTEGDVEFVCLRSGIRSMARRKEQT